MMAEVPRAILDCEVILKMKGMYWGWQKRNMKIQATLWKYRMNSWLPILVFYVKEICVSYLIHCSLSFTLYVAEHKSNPL